MVEIIAFSLLALLMAFLIGCTLMFDDGDIEITPWVYIICGILLVFCVTQVIHNVRNYYSKKECPLTEYNINKKIIAVEENDSTKADTLYFFVKKTNN